MPYVVFAGNVGDVGTLAQAVELVAGRNGTNPAGSAGHDELGKAGA